ncbi:hypothetical protein NADE_002006 [Nannochloris sp. 'desiccata']|nr:hypothetical protein NADE_002006 [Chlorella desiccata (nom. nud.)]
MVSQNCEYMKGTGAAVKKTLSSVSLVFTAVIILSAAVMTSSLGRPQYAARVYSVKDSTIYGHVHMAKTAGPTLNGELAARFERVCGHKG